MIADFHIFISLDDRVFTIKQDGMDESRVFPSLAEAIGNLRNQSTGFVVIHDEAGNSANRIPLSF